MCRRNQLSSVHFGRPFNRNWARLNLPGLQMAAWVQWALGPHECGVRCSSLGLIYVATCYEIRPEVSFSHIQHGKLVMECWFPKGVRRLKRWSNLSLWLHHDWSNEHPWLYVQFKHSHSEIRTQNRSIFHRNGGWFGWLRSSWLVDLAWIDTTLDHWD